ncbi:MULTISPECIES: HvfA family oxazolone/thioamide-modified RiPP metallophore [Xanthomonas]|uniref:Uncharacterized protein n=1 Tax=Xanthomonas rydalmerensis TaxID=3046274 RepID=A0ABZ0JSH4_9XANT|nr:MULTISPECIES: hypothetical protein [unclassified Xanthomonas]MBB5943041.1 putative low-complexity protein [Xanthomonas sp. 3307]MXV06376.1 hypothetical protein [Xanthomonas sp. LMG 9002]WOS42268.1 hypothetical protein QN243_07465 [Xanthomonas sp. DM-2023]WOS46455.1 hypothetical protein QN242_07465 [Xanthomonas sp. DM-2023]WOS50634.1 hypothetical protein QN240_07465 [Xanthomonas sp. DM-2023]
MSRSPRPSPALAGAVLLGGIGLSASALAMTDLAQGYALGAQAAVTPPQSTEATAPATPAPPAQARQAADPAKASEGGCGAKAGDGSCGAHAPAATPAKPEAAAGAATPQAKHDDKAMAEGKCGEGKCGGSL